MIDHRHQLQELFLRGSLTVGGWPSYPSGAAYDPVNGNIYVTNSYYAGYVSVIDGTTNTLADTIGGGSGLDGITYDSADGYLYMTDSVSNGAVVIDGATGTITTTVTVGTTPNAVVYDPANGDVYVTNQASGTVSVIDGGTGTGASSSTTSGDNSSWAATLNPGVLSFVSTPANLTFPALTLDLNQA